MRINVDGGKYYLGLSVLNRYSQLIQIGWRRAQRRTRRDRKKLANVSKWAHYKRNL